VYKYTSVTLSRDLLKIVDRAIKGKGFNSRADFVKTAIRNELERLKK